MTRRIPQSYLGLGVLCETEDIDSPSQGRFQPTGVPLRVFPTFKWHGVDRGPDGSLGLRDPSTSCNRIGREWNGTPLITRPNLGFPGNLSPRNCLLKRHRSRHDEGVVVSSLDPPEEECHTHPTPVGRVDPGWPTYRVNDLRGEGQVLREIRYESHKPEGLDLK